MNWLSDWGWDWILSALVVIGLIATVVRVRRIRRDHQDHRVARFFDWPIDDTGHPTRFYWREGVTRSEVENALYGRTDRRWGWLSRPAMRRALVIANPVSWALTIYGATDLPLNLGFDQSALSWWALAPIPLWLAVRRSVRLIADAPDELLDERLIEIRNRVYVTSYRSLAAGIATVAAIVIVMDALSDSLSAAGADTQIRLLIGCAVAAIWASVALPSVHLAWTLRDEASDEPSSEPSDALC